MENVLKAKVTREQHIDAYLRIWNGGLQLTNKELTVVKELVKSYIEFKDGGVKEPYLTEILFSINNIRRIKKNLNISKQYWGNLKSRLLEKKVLLKGADGIVFLNTMFVPKKELTFKFEIIDERKY